MWWTDAIDAQASLSHRRLMLVPHWSIHSSVRSVECGVTSQTLSLDVPHPQPQEPPSCYTVSLSGTGSDSFVLPGCCSSKGHVVVRVFQWLKLVCSVIALALSLSPCVGPAVPNPLSQCRDDQKNGLPSSCAPVLTQTTSNYHAYLLVSTSGHGQNGTSWALGQCWVNASATADFSNLLLSEFTVARLVLGQQWL